jgi:hypothetical protein
MTTNQLLTRAVYTPSLFWDNITEEKIKYS